MKEEGWKCEHGMEEIKKEKKKAWVREGERTKHEWRNQIYVLEVDYTNTMLIELCLLKEKLKNEIKNCRSILNSVVE